MPLSPSARICAARTPAFVAPGLPIETVATGTPGGICTVDNSASIPFSAEESIGTPITGRIVCAATTPPRCAAAPAPTMNTFTPRPGASSTSFITRAGERCALATVISLVIPNSFSVSTAACMTGASESEPMRMRTSGKSFPSYVSAVLHALEMYQGCGLVRTIDGRLIRLGGGDDRKDAAAGCDDLAIAQRGARVKHRDVADTGGGIEAGNDRAA